MERLGSMSTLGGVSLTTEPTLVGSTSGIGFNGNAESWFVEALTQVKEALSAMSSTILLMGAAVKKQPNVSQTIKDSLPKLEESLDKLQWLTIYNPKAHSTENALRGLTKEGGKRRAGSPPVVHALKSAKKVRAPGVAIKPKGSVNIPLKTTVSQDSASLNVDQTIAGGWSVVKAAAQGSALSTENARMRQRGGKRSGVNSEAILLKLTAGKTYAEVLSAVRSKVKPESCRVAVKSLRKTKAGGLLVKLQKSSTEVLCR